MIKPILTIAAIAFSSAPVSAKTYSDTVTFSASAVCSELTGVKYPSEAKDNDWESYLTCIQTLHYFNTKYN